MDSSSSLDAVQVIVSIASAAIAAISAAIIAWQAVQTRRSTQAARDAVSIAQAELSHNEMLRDDALKSRIDAEMPRITITAYLHAEVADPRNTPKVIVAGYSGPEDRMTADEYTMPRDGNKQLRARGTVTISNDGPRRLQAHLTRGTGNEVARESLDLAPGETKTLQVSRTETVNRWVELAKRQQGSTDVEPPYDVAVLRLMYRFPGWIGAVENHTVLMGGTVVEPVADNAAAWRPANLRRLDESGQTTAVLAVQPFERIYFRNKPGDDAMGWF